MQPWASYSPSLSFSELNSIIGLFYLSSKKRLDELQEWPSSSPWVSVYPSCLPTQVPTPCNPVPKPQLYVLGWSQVRASPRPPPVPLCPPQLPSSSSVLGARGLGDGRALLLPRPPPGPPAGEREGLGGHRQLLSHAYTLTFQGHRVPVVAKWQTSGRIVGRGTAVWVPSPSGRILCLKSRGLYPALRLLLGRPEPSEGLPLPAREQQLPGAARPGALPEGARRCPGPIQGTRLPPRPAALPPALGFSLLPGPALTPWRPSCAWVCVASCHSFLRPLPPSRFIHHQGWVYPMELSAVVTTITWHEDYCPF